MLCVDNEFVLNQQKQAEYRQEVAANRLAEVLAQRDNEQGTNARNNVRAALGRQLVKLGQRLQ